MAGAPTAPPPPPCGRGRDKAAPGHPWDTPPTPFPSSSSRHRRGKVPERHRRHCRANSRPSTTTGHENVSIGSADDDFITSEEKPCPKPLYAANRRRLHLRLRRASGQIPAATDHHRARCQTRRPTGEHLVGRQPLVLALVR